MRFYYTHNAACQAVKRAFEESGIECRDIGDFTLNSNNSIFYGLLRGSGGAILSIKRSGTDHNFYYMDNGYFDAFYIDRNKIKNMTGNYRIVKNDLVDVYRGAPTKVEPRRPLNLLILPPSEYTAFMYDTTPEDWLQEWTYKAIMRGDRCFRRNKDHLNLIPFEESVKQVDAVLAFNSMGVMQAIEMGKPIYTTHGIIRNADKFDTELQYFDSEKLREYYEPKQLTLEEIAEGRCQFGY